MDEAVFSARSLCELLFKVRRPEYERSLENTLVSVFKQISDKNYKADLIARRESPSGSSTATALPSM